jgi:ATP-dependent protease HslVU (ClpYQ) peptidase subunit
MSVIVAVKNQTGAAIASDTACTHNDLIVPARYRVNHQKIFIHGSSFMGFVGSSAVSGAFESITRAGRHQLKLGSQAEIFESFLDLHRILKERYYMSTQDEDSSGDFEAGPVHALILNSSGIYQVGNDRHVTEYSSYWAIGAGGAVALGALHALHALYALYERHQDPSAIATAAVEAACEFAEGCGLPVDCRILGKRAPRRVPQRDERPVRH